MPKARPRSILAKAKTCLYHPPMNPGKIAAIPALFFSFVTSLPVLCSTTNAEEITLDSVVASVDGKPITLQEINRHLNPPRNLSLQQASLDLEARRVLDAMIMEQLIEAEAAGRKIKIADEEVTSYVDEVAQRNGLDRSAFEAALRGQGLTLEEYRRQVRLELLRSKLGAHVMQSAPAVTSKEVQAYLDEHTELGSGGVKVKLRQIFIRREGKTEESFIQKIDAAKDRLARGDDFGKVAREYSEGSEAAEGGALGVVLEKDLNPKIFEAISKLSEGETSEPLDFPDGSRIVLLERRFVEQESGDDSALREEIRRQLERQKSESQARNFFSVDIFKNHIVDKKL